MKQDEAETMARFALDRGLKSFSDEDVLNLCRYILSGDMKREIENAAYERVAVRLDKRSQNYRDTAARTTSDPETIPLLEAAAVASENEAEQIRALIQPPAQKENGE